MDGVDSHQIMFESIDKEKGVIYEVDQIWLD